MSNLISQEETRARFDELSPCLKELFRTDPAVNMCLMEYLLGHITKDQAFENLIVHKNIVIANLQERVKCGPPPVYIFGTMPDLKGNHE